MNKAAGWIAGVVVLLGLSALALRYYVPPLADALELQILFPSAPASESEPLVVTGDTGDGDFLYIKYSGPSSVAFGYDRWGTGGPVSPPVSIQRGRTQRLRIESPSLALTRDSVSHGPDRLRVWLDDTLVLDTPANYDLRRGTRAFFGENPIGGSSCGPRFSGELSWRDGAVLRGRIREILPFSQRLSGWLNFGRWQVFGVLLASIGAGWLTTWVTRTRSTPMFAFLESHRAGPHRWFITAAAPCVLVFCWFVTDGTGCFFFPESFGNFYDHQAASLLRGQLDVPVGVISGEAFVVGGRYYGYFGVTPALLRLPFVIFDAEFGQLSRGFMLVYFLASLGASYALLRVGTRLLRGPTAAPSPWATVILTLAAGLGSTLLFLGTRAYIYHEAILCGATFALWSTCSSLRWLARPESRWWLGALGSGILAMHARPTTGLFALSTLGAVALVHLLRSAPPAARRHLAIGVGAVLGVLSFSGLSYLKFGTFDGSPLRYSIQYTPKRLAKFDGKNFHLVNVANNFDTYVRRPRIWVDGTFPYLYFDGGPNRTHPEKKMDLEEPTAGFPVAMPALFVLTVAGSFWALFHVAPLRPAIVVLWAGVLPMAGALFAAIVTSHRYTGDFCPFLIAASALSLALLDGAPGPLRRVALGIATLLTLASIATTLALSLHFQGEIVWGVPDHVKQNYQKMQRRVDAFFGAQPR